MVDHGDQLAESSFELIIQLLRVKIEVISLIRKN